MKKNYTKPSLLSETFVANNIMSEETERLSTGVTLYLGNQKYNFVVGEGNKLNTISISDFTGNN